MQAQTVATAAAAVAGFNEIDLAFARYKANADGERVLTSPATIQSQNLTGKWEYRFGLGLSVALGVIWYLETCHILGKPGQRERKQVDS